MSCGMGYERYACSADARIHETLDDAELRRLWRQPTEAPVRQLAVTAVTYDTETHEVRFED